jgi:hypothetical protein
MILSDAEPPVRQTAIIYRLPTFAQDRRSDLRAVREKIGSIDDMTRFDELLRVLANAPGHYLIEDRLDGQVAGTRVVEVKPQVESLSGVAGTANMPAAQQATGSQPVFGGMGDAVREFKDVIKELSPPQPAESLDVAIDRALARQREEFTRTLEQLKTAQAVQPPPPPKSFVEQANELKAAAEVMGMGGSNNAVPSVDPVEQFKRQVETYKELSEVVNPIRDVGERGTAGKVFDFLGDAMKFGKEIVPLAAAIIGGRAQAAAAAGMTDTMPPEGAPMPTSQPTAAQPQALSEPQNENEAMVLIAHVAVADLIKNKRVGRTADLIEELAVRFPPLTNTINQFISTPPESALALLGQFTQRNDLGSFRHARGWVEDLIAELLPEDDSEPEATQHPGDAVPNILEMASARAS